jgi:hypothetical protein
MIYVYFENGIVTDRVRVDPFTIFSEQYAEKFIEAPDGVEPGWLYDGTTFSAPPAPIVPEVIAPAAPTKEELLAQVQALTAQIQALE